MITDDELLQRHLNYECECDCPFCIEDNLEEDYDEGIMYDEY